MPRGERVSTWAEKRAWVRGWCARWKVKGPLTSVLWDRLVDDARNTVGLFLPKTQRTEIASSLRRFVGRG